MCNILENNPLIRTGQMSDQNKDKNLLEIQIKNCSQEPEIDYDSDNEVINSSSSNPSEGSLNSKMGPPAKPKRLKDTFYKIEECQYILPDLDKSFSKRRNQFFMFKFPIELDSKHGPKPHPTYDQAIDVWNRFHVKMPNSPSNTVEISQTTFIGLTVQKTVTKWKLIKEGLSLKICSFDDFNKIVRNYNHYEAYDFDVMRKLLTPTPLISNAYPILNYIAQLALLLPKLITKSIRLLKQRNNCTLFLTQKQIACLLANAFFCTFPRRTRDNEEYETFPTFNFVSLFVNNGDSVDFFLKIEKLKCIFNYFERVQQENPKGVVSFERRYLKRTPEWEDSKKLFKKLSIETQGSIEENGKQYSEIEFANKLIGGGVLNTGAYQEEIRFLISPELIVARLFTEELLDEEALIINGTVRYNQHEGYGRQFKWLSSLGHSTQSDQWGRHLTQVIAIDAIDFQSSTQSQFGKNKIDRDLNKAFCGFRDDYQYKNNEKPAIASGKWGCGGFIGDPFLKCLLQFIAASQADRDLILFIRSDKGLEEKLIEFNKLVVTKSLSLGEIYRHLLNYSKENEVFRINSNVIEYVCKQYR